MDRALNYTDRSSVSEPELQKMIEDAERTVAQVIPTPSHVLGRISPIFPPFFPRFLRVFTVSTRRFQRAQNRNPGPRDSVKGAQTPFCRPS